MQVRQNKVSKTKIKTSKIALSTQWKLLKLSTANTFIMPPSLARIFPRQALEGTDSTSSLPCFDTPATLQLTSTLTSLPLLRF